MAVPIADAPAAGAAPASEPAAAPAAAVATPATEAAPTPVSTPSGAPTGTDAQGSQSGAQGADADPLTDLAEMSADERKTFGEAINGLPPEGQKLLKKFLTSKTQTIATTVKEVQAQAQLLADLKSDPVGTAQRIIDEAGKSGVVPGQPASSSPSGMADGVVANAAVAALETQLGPDLAFLAPALAPAMESIAREIATKEIAPIKAERDSAVMDAKVARAEQAATAFVARHPDIEKFQPQMAALAQKYWPNGLPDNLDPAESLELLYREASAPVKDGDKARDVVDRINASAAASASASPNQGVPASRVTDNRKETLSLRESFNAAKRELESARA